MRKDLGNKLEFLPLPVLIIGTYDKDGNANAMNAAWGGIYDYGRIMVSLDKHKTTENLEVSKAFTISFATKKTMEISDYFGIVSGSKEDKIKKSGVHVEKSKHVNAPIITEYPLTLECTVDSLEDGILIGKIVNTSIDTKYLKENDEIDIDKMKLITFDMTSNTYRTIGKVAGNAFQAGLLLKMIGKK